MHQFYFNLHMKIMMLASAWFIFTIRWRGFDLLDLFFLVYGFRFVNCICFVCVQIFASFIVSILFFRGLQSAAWNIFYKVVVIAESWHKCVWSAFESKIKIFISEHVCPLFSLLNTFLARDERQRA